MAAPARSLSLFGILVLLLVHSDAREPHVINGFKPASETRLHVQPQAQVIAQQVQAQVQAQVQSEMQAVQAHLAHHIDAQPSDPVDEDGVPGYGLNGAHGNLTPWLPSQPTWQLPQQQLPQVQQTQYQQQQLPQVQQTQYQQQQLPQYQRVEPVQQNYQQVEQVAEQRPDGTDMMRVIYRPGSAPTGPTPHYIVNRPPAGDRVDTNVDVTTGSTKPSQTPTKKPSNRPAGPPSAPGAVSETDMYLLGAIEKLVYRVDHLEKRLRRSEELVYYLMEGSGNKQEAAEPCPKDFTRAGRNCYHFSGRDLNWKSSSSACKAMDSILVEIIAPEDKRDLVNWITAHQEFRGRDFWTGGLNPGLLWIWANSARPVSSSAQNGTHTNAIKNPSPVDDIPGSGRCLKLAHNPATRQYNYQGGDCSTRFRFICQLEEPSSSRALSRIRKSLNIHLDGLADSKSPPAPPSPTTPQ